MNLRFLVIKERKRKLIVQGVTIITLIKLLSIIIFIPCLFVASAVKENGKE